MLNKKTMIQRTGYQVEIDGTYVIKKKYTYAERLPQNRREEWLFDGLKKTYMEWRFSFYQFNGAMRRLFLVKFFSHLFFSLWNYRPNSKRYMGLIYWNNFIDPNYPHQKIENISVHFKRIHMKKKLWDVSLNSCGTYPGRLHVA